MSNFNPHLETESIYEAAADCRQRSLIDQDSLLSPGEALWTTNNLDELDLKFVQNPDEGGANFQDKLSSQLAGASPSSIRLMAELLWLLTLFQSNIRASTKRQLISEVWALSGEQLPSSTPYLSDEVLGGIGSAGTAYNTQRWRELAFLITTLRTLRAHSSDEQRAILSDGQKFIEWLDGQEGANNRQLTNILPHLLFPDQFERISSRADKEAILTGFTGENRSVLRKRSIPPIRTQPCWTFVADLRPRVGRPLTFMQMTSKYAGDLQPINRC